MAASVAWGDEEAAGMHRGSHLKVRSVCKWCLSRFPLMRQLRFFWVPNLKQRSSDGECW